MWNTTIEEEELMHISSFQPLPTDIISKGF